MSRRVSVRTKALLVATLTASTFLCACGDDDPVTSGAGGAGSTVGSGGSASVGSSGGEGPGGSGAGGALECDGEGPGPSLDAPKLTSSSAASFGPRQETAVVALDGQVYVIGGFTLAGISASVERYDPALDAWTEVAPLPEAMHHANAAVVGGKIYVVGFLTGGNFQAQGRGYVYDPGANAWTTIAAMPAGTERGSAVVGAVGTEVLVVGGLRGGQAVADASAYDTISDTWRALPPLPEVRDHAVGGVVGGTLYVIGGRATTIGSISSDVYAFRPEAGEWCRRASLPTPRGGAAAAVVGSEIVVIGGEGNPDHPSGTFRDVEVYDALTNRWRVDAPLAAGRHGTGAASVDGVVVLPGGADVQAFGAIGSVVRLGSD
jgi:N-acetylneuraminic acid mutarotase